MPMRSMRCGPCAIPAIDFGDSYAERDLVDQTLMDAAIRDGQRRPARHLLIERLLAKAKSPFTERSARRIG